MNTNLAIIDLGTNTFHLLIASCLEKEISPLYKQSLPARLGAAGINQNLITPEAIQRGLEVLHHFKNKLQEFNIDPENVYAFGTSAIRNASNREAFQQQVLLETGIKVQEIDGNREAHLIYLGVRNAIKLGSEPALIMDIGGGSVEFIIANQEQVFWKQSFEIGGQRLIEKFMTMDMLTDQNRKKLYNYIDEALIPLANAVHQYAPTKLVGAAGAFETLVDMESFFTGNGWSATEKKDYSVGLESFYRMYAQILTATRAERMDMAGMIPLRVDMIVVAVCLIEYVIKKHHLQEIQISRYALKEGALISLHAQDEAE
jgi:exopolyphosphatase/guanosine-5'-triphosphate,3'-diphosphate pyrophosphatase